MKQTIVVLTGAGISAESGLKTFRDIDGLWEGYDIEEVATPRGWAKNPELVLEFYNQRRRNVQEAQPNKAHLGLVLLEKYFNVYIITQNIDDLHERAGSTNILHLHGEILKMRSEKNAFKTYPILEDIKYGDKAPDGGQLRPDIVWFEESVPMMEKAVHIIETADIFVLVGSSLVVYPAAGLINFVKPHVKKYILDKNIPSINNNKNVIPIEKPATFGILDLLNYLDI